MADNASTAGPKSTFEAYRAEGDMLFKQQDFKKALESYDQVSIVLDNFHSSHLWLTIGYYVYVCTHSQFKSKTLTWQNNIVSLQSKYSKIHSFHSSIALIALRMSTLLFDFSMAFVVHSCWVKNLFKSLLSLDLTFPGFQPVQRLLPSVVHACEMIPLAALLYLTYMFMYIHVQMKILHYNFIQAMELRNDDRNCLVARSRCYLQLGDTDSALKDAEASMQEDANFFKV